MSLTKKLFSGYLSVEREEWGKLQRVAALEFSLPDTEKRYDAINVMTVPFSSSISRVGNNIRIYMHQGCFKVEKSYMTAGRGS